MNYKSHNGFCTLQSLFTSVAALFFSSSLVAGAAETTLAWDANTEPDVTGYQVHYGTASGSYTQTIDVGNRTEATISQLASGATYYFAVTAYNSAGMESLPSNEAFAEFPQVIANEAPTVSLTSPQSGSSYLKRTEVSLTSSAADVDGTVSKVEFYVGSTKVAEDFSAPFTAIWVPAGPGSFPVIARAIDDRGLASDSAAVTVKIINSTVKGGGGGGKKPSSTSYAALIESSDPTVAYAGSLTLTTTSEGTYSGKLTQDGVSYPIKGRLDADGRASLVVTRFGKSPLALTLQADGTGISGSLSDGTTPSAFVAKKNVGSGAQATRSAGRWTVLLSGPDAVEGETPHPQGTGVATLVVSKNGSTRFTGTLADGTAFSQGGKLSESSSLPVYISLYRKRGTLAGVMELPQSDTDPKTLSGSAEWYKPVGLPSQTYYPAGFRIPLELFGELLPAITATSPAQNARSAAPAHEITVFGGNLVQAISKSVSPFPGGTHIFGGDEQLVFSVRPSGKFSGSFIDAESGKRRRFIGASLPTSQIGGGFFLGSDEGGGVVLSPAL